MKPERTYPVVTHIISGDIWAGAEVQVYQLCRALLISGKVGVTAVIFNKGMLHDKLMDLGISITLADETRMGPVAIARAIASHCIAYDTTIVHTHGFKENVLGIAGKEIARVRYSVRTVHGNPEIPFKIIRPHKWLIQKLDIFLGRWRQQSVIAVSSQLETSLQRLFPGKVQKIFNFVDVDELRKEWSPNSRMNNPIPRIGIVGRLVPVKRVDLFLEALSMLRSQGIAFEGLVIGSGPLEPDLRRLTEQLNLIDQVRFTGFVSPAVSEIRNLDILVMSSDHEGLPMTLLEALALEIPIIAHNVGGIREILNEDRCGWLVNNHTAKGYADTVRAALESPHARVRRAQFGLKQTEEMFNATRNREQYEAVYENMQKKD